MKLVTNHVNSRQNGHFTGNPASFTVKSDSFARTRVVSKTVLFVVTKRCHCGDQNGVLVVSLQNSHFHPSLRLV